MMHSLTGILLRIGDSPAASIVLKATVAIALVLLGVWLARRRSAAVRHAMLASAFVVLLLLPLASTLGPAVKIAVRQRAALQAVTWSDNGTPQGPGAIVNRRRHPNAAPPTPSFSPASLLLPVWICGVALSLFPIGLSWWKVRTLRRCALPWIAGRRILRPWADEAGITRRVELLLDEAIPGPMTCGLFRPAILLPADAPLWRREDLIRALVHELEHVRRRDWASHSFARLVCALYWFHPLVWMAWRRLALEAERSCDNAVVAHSEATAYADQLVGLAQRLSAAARTPYLAMASRSDLAARIGALLDGRQTRERAGRAAIALACLGAAALVFGVAPLRIAAAPQQPAAGAPEFDAVSVKLIDKTTGANHSHEGGDAGRLEISGNVHRFLIRAYGITEAQLGGEPEWFESHLYAIQAVTSAKATREQMMLMLRAALADRFQLKLHEEERELPVYVLQVAPGGPKFHGVEPGEQLESREVPEGMFGRYFMTIENLVNNLNSSFGGPLRLERPVIDRTNLPGGRYKMYLLTERDEDASGQGFQYPNLIHDLQSQLGLKLSPEKVKMPFYQVEHAAEPTPN